MLIPQNGDRAGLYLRLSRDDDTKKESYSITNQRKILTTYAEEHNFKIIDEYIDDEPSADMVPIINFFNEFHAKQTSRKTRASKKVMAQGGKFIGTKAPFGYVIDPDDKHHLLVDEEAALTVRLIFQYACDGLGFKAIAKRLRDAGVMNPTAYNNIRFPTLHKSEYWLRSLLTGRPLLLCGHQGIFSYKRYGIFLFLEIWYES
jgi:DNA invertase Pin-like site-specific DNA recombinase